MLVILYPCDTVGLNEENTLFLEEVFNFALDISLPLIVVGDFNIIPERFYTSRFITERKMVIVTPNMESTCQTPIAVGVGNVVEFVVMDAILLPTVTTQGTVNEFKSHAGILIEFLGKGWTYSILALRVPRDLQQCDVDAKVSSVLSSKMEAFEV